MKIKCVYIDDVNTERSKYKSRFENDDRTKERFAIATYNAPKSLDDYERIAAENPELLMVDYDLSVPDDNGHVIGFQGIALATQLRQQFPEIPIVLFTRKSVFRFHDYDNISKSLSAIDDIIYKQDLFNTNLSNIEKLFQLSVGFKLMRNQRSRGWDDILKLMGASQNDAGLLKLADPPIMHRKSWATVAVATWLKKVIFQYPGILYDSMYAATFLGVSSEAFASEPIQSLFTSSKYSGIFQPAEGLWWKSKLHSVAYSLMNKK
jgi:CheY-like chemotaxis protein